MFVASEDLLGEPGMPLDTIIDIIIDSNDVLKLEQQADNLHLFTEEYCALIITRELKTDISSN